MAFRDTLIDSWRKPNALTFALWPLSQLYRALFSLNRKLYQVGIKSSFRAPAPVIIVGNITVGGTGKTPLVIFLVELLRERGYRPAVISRGYAGNSPCYPLLVTKDTPVLECGDEPSLIVRRTGVPMCVGPNRQQSIELLIDRHDVDVIISDDGLQHFALERDIELCLVDQKSSLLNKCLLPAGPFREVISRLSTVDFVIHHGGDSRYSMSLQLDAPRNIVGADKSFDHTKHTHALAGIGNPQRFFDACLSLGLNIESHAFPDHHQFSRSDIDFGDAQVIMTEKDAVKCEHFADQQHWYLPVDAKLSAEFNNDLIDALKRVNI